ncbi:MAG: DUF445 domain-containing protein [Pseudonocardiaceae bacterium]
MDIILADLAQNWAVYAAIPFIAALIGYLTKRVAIEMMFRPLTFVGIKPFLGWQGVVPKHGVRMAATAADLVTENLIDPREVFEKIDPERVSRELEQPLLNAIDNTARAVLAEHHPAVWESLPPMGQDLVIKQLQAAAPNIVRQLIEELRTNVDAVLDLRQMAIEQLTGDKATLVRIIRDLSRPEMAFIARSGIYSGFLLGIAQSVVWALTKEPLVMPIFGFAIGFLTDWLAINLVFLPRRPVSLFGRRTVHGKFHRRRAEVARQYGEIIATELLTVPKLLEGILSGPRSDRVFAMVRRMVNGAVDEQASLAKPIVALAIGTERMQEMKRDAAGRAMRQFADTARHARGYLTETMDVAEVVEQRMLALSAEQYENLIRPAFKQDEWKLILVGGVIGGIVGELQVLLMLH